MATSYTSKLIQLGRNGVLGRTSSTTHRRATSGVLSSTLHYGDVGASIGSTSSVSALNASRVNQASKNIFTIPAYAGNSVRAFSTTTPPPPSSSSSTGTHEFQAETKQLLDIVTNSLYKEKEVFLRELISNASDACEKLRQLQQQGGNEFVQGDLPLEIRVELDEVTSTITITDTGIGMDDESMREHLGTIAKSGSKAFQKELLERSTTGEADLDIANGIIGKFGVGFYSVFMVAKEVEVRSTPALIDKESSNPDGWAWKSDGKGTYDLATLDPSIRQDRGTSIVIHLESDYWHLIDEKTITGLLKEYSNFIQFPIFVNGQRVNTIQAVWTQDPKEVDRETYVDFYKYIANAIDDPLDIYHFRADVPLDVKALFFIPSFHSEKYGMGQMEPGVNLYSRKVLIEAKSKSILPDWMRFVKGVVDSEDLPLAVSRETPQDAALMRQLRKTLTRKFLANLEKMAKKEKVKYLDEFYKEYAFFLKEGVCQDFEFQKIIAKLLYFETNKQTQDKLSSFDEYIANMRPEQKEIYYLCAPTRDTAALSPYLEAFEQRNLEVIFIFSAIDDYVMANVESYEGRKLVSVEKSSIDLSVFDEETEDKKDDASAEKGDTSSSAKGLDAVQAMEFCAWMKMELGDSRVASCRPSTRLVSSPAIVTDNESGQMRRMMRLVDTSEGNRDSVPLPKQNMEINPSHELVVGIDRLRSTEPVLARVLAEQVYDNCLIAAGLLDDGRTMLPRLNDLLLSLVKGASEIEKAKASANDSDSDSDSASDSGSDSDSDEKDKPKKD